MKKTYRSHEQNAVVSSAAKLIIVCLTCLAIKAASKACVYFQSISANDGSISGTILSLELPSASSVKHSLLSLEFPLVDLPESEVPENILDTPTQAVEEKIDDEATLPPADDSETTDDTETPAVDTTITGDKNQEYQLVSEGIYIKNTTGYDIDVDSLLSSELGFSASDGAEVLIIHTHGSEAYSQSDGYTYEESEPSRTLDRNYNVVRVGDKLAEILTERGISVIHDTTLYDYPDYNHSYANAAEGIFSALTENPNIKVVIDLHRDALEDADGTVYKTVADIGNEPCSQVMLVVGTDYSGLQHDNWQENLKFALKLQAQMVLDYPSLARPLQLTKYRYNQHATTGSLIVEVGCSGNTLSESLNAITYFADCLADVLGT